MKSKVFFKVGEKSDNLFNDGIQSIEQFINTLPKVSSNDKKGRKFSKRMKPLLKKAIESVPQLENELPRDFTIQNMLDNKEAYESNETKIDDLQRQINRLLGSQTIIGMQLDMDYRTIYGAAQSAAKHDASLTVLRDELSAPFQKNK